MNDILQTRQFENLIFELRGFKVMIDMDLASLYETETKRLKEQVKRNKDRFPDDFMFELTLEEKEQRSQIVIKKLKSWLIRSIRFTDFY
ncbi:MAG TPA: ORF6N domain-containing protein [Daejeonella sp.]|uniref:ORF6N domain-containing protein n=1 Tax=Daejeonella sp. TaxID=2805397 RepID=UPI002ED82FD6